MGVGALSSVASGYWAAVMGSKEGQSQVSSAFQRQPSVFPMATKNNKLTPFLDKEISHRDLRSITCSVCCFWEKTCTQI